MKNIKKILYAILISYIGIGALAIGKIYITHQIYIHDLPVLGYHSVVSDEEKESFYAYNPYVMSASDFDKQMRYLYDHGYYTLTMDEVYEYYVGNMDLPSPCIVLTFDDGFLNFNTVVKPIIQKYNFHATAFVIGKKLQQEDKQKSGLSYLKTKDVVNDEYVSYYSHSYNLHRFANIPYHKIIETLSKKEIEADFTKSKEIIDTTYFAYPYGVSSDNALTVLENSHTKLAFSYNQNRHMSRHDNPYYLPRYQMFSSMPMWYFKWIVEQK